MIIVFQQVQKKVRHAIMQNNRKVLNSKTKVSDSYREQKELAIDLFKWVLYAYASVGES